MCGGRGIWEISVSPSRLCCELKSALKRNSLKIYEKWGGKKKNIDTDFLKHKIYKTISDKEIQQCYLRYVSSLILGEGIPLLCLLDFKVYCIGLIIVMKSDIPSDGCIGLNHCI